MRIIYSKREKNDISMIKRKITLGLECLMLAFVMCVLGIALMLKNMRELSVAEKYKEVSGNIVFDIIELEVDKEPSENSTEKGNESQKMSFWEIFEEKQRQNNGKAE